MVVCKFVTIMCTRVVLPGRSTPCPQVKQHDEWGDPTACDSGDHCQYCHTRTEQQFYPEVSTTYKCQNAVHIDHVCVDRGVCTEHKRNN